MNGEQPTLTVCMGSPASGKSTWCRENSGDALVLSADSIRVGANPTAVFNQMLREARRSLARGKNVIIDTCSSRSCDRSPWLSLARRKRARTKLVIFDTPTALCARRDARRSRSSGNFKVYAARIRESMRQIGREGWGEIVVIKSSVAPT